jgi:hypothetical protein
VRVSIVAALVAGIMPVFVASAFAGGRPATYSDAGLTITVPAGWHVVHERLTPCTNPLERLTLSGRGALVTLMETLDPRRYVRRYSPRPRRFALRGEPQWIACCAPLDRKGWFFDFRDNGRGFYAYVYLGQPGTKGEALGALDSLHIRPRPR